MLRSFLPVFARSGDREVGLALVGALERSPSAEVLSPAELDRALAKYPAAVEERADPLRAKLAARQAGKAAYLARLSAELAPLRGDADAGHELFLSQRAGLLRLSPGRGARRDRRPRPVEDRPDPHAGGTAGVDPLPRI